MPDVELHQKTYPCGCVSHGIFGRIPNQCGLHGAADVKPTLESAPYTPPALNQKVTLNCHKFAFHVEADTVDEFRAKVYAAIRNAFAPFPLPLIPPDSEDFPPDTHTVVYADGSTATGPGILPLVSPTGAAAVSFDGEDLNPPVPPEPSNG